MSPLAIAVMVFVCGVVWGGFAILLTLALKREARRGNDGGSAGRGRRP